MQPHEERVVAEKAELDAKLARLSAFISASPNFSSLDEIDRQLLREQREAMCAYSDALGERIARFS